MTKYYMYFMERDNRIIYDEWLSLDSQREKYRHCIYKQFMNNFDRDADHLSLSRRDKVLRIFGRKGNNRAILKMLEDAALQKESELTSKFIIDLHKALLKKDYKAYMKLPNGKRVFNKIHVGVYKRCSNTIVKSSPDLTVERVSPKETPASMENLLKWYNECSAKGDLDGIELASLFAYRYVSIHPFDDGNGRTSRLLVNYILRSHGYPMIIFPKNTRNYYLYVTLLTNKNIANSAAARIQATPDQVRPLTEYIEDLVAEQMQREIDIVQSI